VPDYRVRHVSALVWGELPESSAFSVPP
jgi:hypothetical protein